MPAHLILQEILGFRLVTADAERLVAFYRAIGFEIGAPAPISAAEMGVLGLEGTGSRRLMRRGGVRVDLDAFDPPGDRYPADASACDQIFQHLALVTEDADAAWRAASRAGATQISRGGPVQLPKSAGGVIAVKFRDPEGHPLEFLQFPSGADHGRPGVNPARIDHSAICVADVSASQSFYTRPGLREGERSLNHGPTQEALDGLDAVEVDVVPMNPVRRPPHLELLGYRRPTVRATAPPRTNDIAATRVVWRADEDALLRDPDGHLHQLTR